MFGGWSAQNSAGVVDKNVNYRILGLDLGDKIINTLAIGHVAFF